MKWLIILRLYCYKFIIQNNIVISGCKILSFHKILTSPSADLDLAYSQGDLQSYSPPIKSAKAHLRKISSKVFRLQIKDADNARYEIPDEAEIYQSENTGTVSDSDYEVEYGDSNGRFFFSVSKNGKSLIDSRHGPIMFEDQYLEMSFTLGSYNCYGLGEHNHRNG